MISREQIIKAAVNEGPADFSMLAIAKRLNITHGALYRYFPSRDNLAQAVADTILGTGTWHHSNLDWRQVPTSYAHELWRLCSALPGLAACILDLPTQSAALSELIDDHVACLVQLGAPFKDASATINLVTEDVLLTALNADKATCAEMLQTEESGIDQKLSLILTGLQCRLTH